MFFQHAFGNGIFSSFYTKNIIFGLQLGPQLGVKNLQIFVIFASRAQKNPMGTPKAGQSLPWTPPGPSETSKMSFWTSKICIFLPQGY